MNFGSLLAIFEECKHFFEAAAKIVFSLKPQFQVMVVRIYDALGTIIKIVKKLCTLRERGVIYRRALRNIEKSRRIKIKQLAKIVGLILERSNRKVHIYRVYQGFRQAALDLLV